MNRRGVEFRQIRTDIEEQTKAARRICTPFHAIIKMKKFIPIIYIVLLISCKPERSDQFLVEQSIPRDTIRVIEHLIDTVYIENIDQDKYERSEYYIIERLPSWLLNAGVLQGIQIKDAYAFDNRLNPMYLEGDFTGDNILDIIIPIIEIKTQKVGFAVIHGKSNEIHILGAGTKIKNGLSDDLGYIDIWKINRKEINEPGLDKNGEIDVKGQLILKNPSIQVEKTEVGGGQIYWDGKEYVYFHQTC